MVVDRRLSLAKGIGRRIGWILEPLANLVEDTRTNDTGEGKHIPNQDGSDLLAPLQTNLVEDTRLMIPAGNLEKVPVLSLFSLHFK